MLGLLKGYKVIIYYSSMKLQVVKEEQGFEGIQHTICRGYKLYRNTIANVSKLKLASASLGKRPRLVPSSRLTQLMLQCVRK